MALPGNPATGSSLPAGSTPTTSGPESGTKSLPGICPVNDYEYGPLRNCHNSANAFCDASSGIGWDTRVVQCASDVLSQPSGHTVNIYLDDIATNQWCIIEPQDGTTCCFVDYACSADDVSLAKGTHGGTCAELMCLGQYKTGDQCRVLPANARALTEIDRAVSCADLAEDNASCLQCCGEVTGSLENRWLGTWADTCEEYDTYEEQTRVLSDICLARCDETDPDRLKRLLETLPASISSAVTSAL